MSRVRIESLTVVAIACAVVPSAFVSAANSETAVKWGQPLGYVAPNGSHLPTKYPDLIGKPGKECKIGYVSPLNAIPGLPDQIKGGSGICADTTPTPTQPRSRAPGTAMRHPQVMTTTEAGAVPHPATTARDEFNGRPT